MTNATINIGKSLIKMLSTSKGVIITNHKLGQLNEVINGLSQIEFTGLSKPSKLAKYEAILNNAGFLLSEVSYKYNAGFEGENSDVISFRLIYTL